jgi:hypothetical protein
VINNFKQTDIDPREIVLLFKELQETCPKLAREQLMRAPSVFIPKIVETALANQNLSGAKYIADKIKEGKR